jgi:lipopolysaccharide/colanic/teichoic acid biosynthesis glycosyltransferase
MGGFLDILRPEFVLPNGAILMPEAPHPNIARPALSHTKRAFDIGLSVIMLILSFPIWAVIMLAIIWEDGRPVFFTQERWGLGARRFRVVKFRSMYTDSVTLHGNRLAREEDPRIIPIGRLLRSSGLDELPNLINILKGEMSFVGPRALAVDEVVAELDERHHSYETVPGFLERLSVRPGLTGLATIYLPRDAKPRRKFNVDLLYIRRWSLFLDLRLVALSFLISFRGRWETRAKKVRS